MKEQPLPSKIKSVWRLTAFLTTAVEIIIILGLIAAHQLWRWPLWLIWLGIILSIIGTAIDFTLIPYRYAFSHYQITSTAVYLKSGYIFRKEESIPITRIQNVTLEAGPLLQHWNLQKVNVETASTTHTIAGVTPETAEQLQNQILHLAKEARDDL
ncbi:hypothetical protein FEZ51_05305 [Pediococcus stilesii]|uniref:YdbS-like PH domain-containing protein n=1 Tax=Pediococcus stilesii TaxID=331679 RepID=A0A5R9BV07_9LACO|nr:PH domain-containing protein [Pediococcus stilesii]TLQ04479.1 hypothetical protein FEZ51_05305 [Pediococcus stilesii]